MKRVLQLQAIFLPTILHSAFWLMMSTVIIHVGAFHLIPLLGGERWHSIKFLSTLILVFALIIAGQSQQKLPKQNLPWLLLSPIEKTALPFHLALIRAVGIMTPLLATLSGIALASLVSGAGLTGFLAVGTFRGIWSAFRVAPSELLHWVFAITYINCLALIFFSGVSNESSVATYAWNTLRRRFAISKTFGVGFIILGTLAVPLAVRYLHPISFALLIVATPLTIPFHLKQELGFSRTAYGRALHIATLICAVQVTLLSAKTIAMFYGTTEQKIEMIHILGRWAPQLSEKTLLQMMESPMAYSEATTVTQQFMTHYRKGRKLDRRASLEPYFPKVIGAQHTPHAVMALYEMYDPTTLNLEDLRRMLAALKAEDDASSSMQIAVQLKDIALSEEEMSEIFVAGSLAELKFALTRARYERRPRYAIDILDHLHEWPSKFARHGIDTVSIILGRRVTMEDWFQYRRGERLDMQVASIDCEHIERDIAAANVCLRTNNKAVVPPYALESEGWVEDPFGKTEAGIVSSVLH